LIIKQLQMKIILRPAMRLAFLVHMFDICLEVCDTFLRHVSVLFTPLRMHSNGHAGTAQDV